MQHRPGAVLVHQGDVPAEDREDLSRDGLGLGQAEIYDDRRVVAGIGVGVAGLREHVLGQPGTGGRRITLEVTP